MKTKIHVGCGTKLYDDYVNVDCVETKGIDFVDNCISLDCLKGYEGTFEEVYMNAVYEHFYKDQRHQALRRWTQLLKKGGQIKIDSIPDTGRMCQAYINKEKSFLYTGKDFSMEDMFGWVFGPCNEEPMRHKDIFDKQKLIEEFSKHEQLEIISVKNVFWGKETIDLNLNVVLEKK